jgi:uncharacterized protein (TIGR00369 family)
MYLLSSNSDDALLADSAAQCMASTASAVPATPRGRDARKRFGVVQANELLREKMAPWLQELQLVVEACSPAGAALRLPRNVRLLRLGDTVCGPALMACADTAMAIAVMGRFGDFRNVATVTLNIDFMRPIAAADIIVGATVRNQGRSLIFTECNFIDSRSRAIAVHATATWAVIPALAATPARRERRQ